MAQRIELTSQDVNFGANVFAFALRSIPPRDHFRGDCEVQYLEGKPLGAQPTSYTRSSGCLRRKAPSVSWETFPSRSRRSCGRPTTRPASTYYRLEVETELVHRGQGCTMALASALPGSSRCAQSSSSSPDILPCLVANSRCPAETASQIRDA
jgi:hypothetical protein